jgi:hypothetical protein
MFAIRVLFCVITSGAGHFLSKCMLKYVNLIIELPIGNIRLERAKKLMIFIYWTWSILFGKRRKKRRQRAQIDKIYEETESKIRRKRDQSIFQYPSLITDNRTKKKEINREKSKQPNWNNKQKERNSCLRLKKRKRFKTILPHRTKKKSNKIISHCIELLKK